MKLPNFLILPLLVFIIGFASIGGCDGSDPIGSERYLYTSSNDSAGNSVIILEIGKDGELSQTATVPTGGVGDADEGDFDGQNSLHVISGTDYLLVVNAGDTIGQYGIIDGNGSISVFRINNRTGLLDRIDQDPATPNVDNRDSGGVRPVTISSYTYDGKTWVLVGNQYHNPVFVGSSREGGLRGTREGDPEDKIAVTGLRNVTAFEFVDGVLGPPVQLTLYEDGLNGGPANVAFSPDGLKVAVSTWGVPHFESEGFPKADVQLPSRIYIYDTLVTGNRFQLVNERFFEKIGIAGTIGFSWSPDSEIIYAANANLSQEPESLEAFSLTVISTGMNPELLNNSEVPIFGDAACWTMLTSDGVRLYVASFALNIITYFRVDPPAGLDIAQSFIRQESPLLDTKDMFATRNGRYFYILGPLMTHTVGIYSFDKDGFLDESEFSPFLVPSAHPGGINVLPEQQAFLGLTGY